MRLHAVFWIVVAAAGSLSSGCSSRPEEKQNDGNKPLSPVIAKQQPGKTSDGPFPANIVGAWKEVASDVMWMRLDDSGKILLQTVEPHGQESIPGFGPSVQGSDRSGAVHATAWAELPDPGVPFSLYVQTVAEGGLKGLARQANLQGLNLSLCAVGESDMKELAGMKNLRWLNLERTGINDAGVKHLAGLKKLQMLDLRYADLGERLTDRGLKELCALQNLQSLHLGGRIGLTDHGIKHLAELTKLRFLDLSQAQLTNAGLKELTGMKKLEWLDVGGTQVTHAGLMQLAELKSLKHLKIGELAIGPPYEALRQKLPSCNVAW